ncbi:MAG: dynamin family protein [Pseudomonadota bacterium]
MTETSATPRPAFWKEPEGPRLPRIALMGEFSAGKSTLANLMIGTNPLPVQVVATQLPPVWISYGSQPSVIVDLEGNETECDLANLDGIDPEETAFIRFYCEQEILRQCEIIDLPGISDPNMAQDVWARIMPFADGVLWCSPATQAWRQSEAAVWEEIEDGVQQNSLLVLTRGDMLLTEKDKSKVLKRVRAEAGASFADILMISLVLARDAGDDEDMWAQSGADRFVACFLALVEKIGQGLDPGKTGADAAQSVVFGAQADATENAGDDRASIVPRRPVRRREAVVETPQATPPEADPMSYMPKFS